MAAFILNLGPILKLGRARKKNQYIYFLMFYMPRSECEVLTAVTMKSTILWEVMS
jgi:hypothetical protein